MASISDRGTLVKSGVVIGMFSRMSTPHALLNFDAELFGSHGTPVSGSTPVMTRVCVGNLFPFLVFVAFLGAVPPLQLQARPPLQLRPQVLQRILLMYIY